MESSMGLFEESRFRNVDMALDQEEVSSVVVLCSEGWIGGEKVSGIRRQFSWCGGNWKGEGEGDGAREWYSFAKTPLKAAQAPLAAASASQGVLKIMGGFRLCRKGDGE
jgi:hypothetical protein